MTSDTLRIARIVARVAEEVERAERKHPAMNSPHEGYAVLLEEVDELWDEIKRDEGRATAAQIEAIQVAAMAVRYLLNLTEFMK